jgi:transcriptional regulator with XRE-family HTH domain
MGTIEYTFQHDRIFKAIAQSGLSVWKAAKLCGIKPSSLYQYAKGTATPNGSTLSKLSSGLQVEPGYFFAQKLASELTNEVQQ